MSRRPRNYHEVATSHSHFAKTACGSGLTGRKIIYPTAVPDPSTNSFAYSQSETARTHLHTANPQRVIQP